MGLPWQRLGPGKGGSGQTGQGKGIRKLSISANGLMCIWGGGIYSRDYILGCFEKGKGRNGFSQFFPL